MREIIDKEGKILVIINRLDEWNAGLDFITNDKEFLQVGTWLYDKDKKLDRHHHNFVTRKSNLTQECVVVLTGKMLARVYDDSRCFLDEFVLNSGDFAVFLGGGHEYEIMEDATKIIETKNGPFLGVALDKTKF